MSRVQAITCSTLISRTLWHTLSWAWTVILCQWTCPVYRQSPALHTDRESAELCGTHFPEHEPLFSVNEHVQSTGNHLQHTNQQNFVAHTFLSMNRYSLYWTCQWHMSAELCGTGWMNIPVSMSQAITCSTCSANFVAHTFLSMNQLFSVNEHVQSTGNHLQHTNQQNFVAHTFLSMNRYSLSMNMSRVQAITCSTLISRTLWHTLSWAWTIILCQWTCPEYRQSPAAHNQQNFVAHTLLSMNQLFTHFLWTFSVNEHVQSTGNHLQHTNQQNFVAHTFLSMNRYSLSMNMSRVQAITCST